MIDEFRLALRQLVNRPGFTVAAVLTFALGIGATTAIFSLVNSVMLKPLPYPEPADLVHVFEQRPDGGHNTVSGGAFKDWREHGRSFEYLAIYENARVNLTGTDTPERLEGLRVSANYLSVLGVQPMLGRGFSDGADTPGGENLTVLLTHRLWQNRFSGDRGAVGRTLALDGVAHTVIGVLPPGALMQDESFLVPNVVDGVPGTWTRSGHWRNVIGRLRQDVDREQAQAELRAIKQRMADEYPAFKQDWSVAVVPTQEVYASGIRTTLLVLLGTVVCVLLIACSNVSNLMLARAAGREQEMSVRRALGAGTSRIVRQVLAESLLLALAGCAAGLLVAALGVKLLGTMLTGMLPYVMPHALYPELDWRVLAFSVSLACGCGVLFGLLPALRSGRFDPAGAMKAGERGSQTVAKKRSQSLLLAAQFAFTLVLLIGAGLLLRSFALLLETEPGFRPQQAMAFDVSLPEAKYPDAESRVQVTDRLLQRIEAVPGVEAAGVTSYVPLSNRGATEFLSRVDQPFSADYVAGFESVSGAYDAALGLVLLQGRFISSDDNRTDAPRVLVVNERVARDLYPDQSPLGQQLRLLGEAWEIVGVVGSVRHQAVHVAPAPRVYSAYARSSWSTSIVVRSANPPLTLVESVRQAVLDVDPDQPIANVRTLEHAVRDSLARHRVTLTLLGIFAALAVVIACVGVYGVMAYTIRQREHELGIRSALGANRGAIVRLVMGGGLKSALIGIGVGLIAATALARFIETLLFEVRSDDPVVFASAISVLGLVAVLAVFVPARRAGRIDPMRALRDE